MKNYITPTWPAPKNIKAYTTTRIGGNSQPPFSSFNLGSKTKDNPNDVLSNRKQLSLELNLPNEPFWLEQKHTNIALRIDKDSKYNNSPTDASFTTDTNTVCTVLTADCIPILICDSDGTIVAAIHAGWKGIANGIIEKTIKNMNINPLKLLAWLGPAIGPNAFIVQHDFYEIFYNQNPETKSAFKIYENRFLANIYELARIYLKLSGVGKIFGGEFCTYTQENLFYSFRRDKEKSGRMASLIWIET